jgi:hypothetical protein
MFQITMEKLWNVEQFFFIKNSSKSKFKIIKKVGCAFGIVGKPLVSRILMKNLKVFKPKVKKILNSG